MPVVPIAPPPRYEDPQRPAIPFVPPELVAELAARRHQQMSQAGAPPWMLFLAMFIGVMVLCSSCSVLASLFTYHH